MLTVDGDSIKLNLFSHTKLYILGQANIRILEGAVSILGRVLHENDHENYPIYSPPISALLFLENFSNDSKATKIELSSLNNGLEVISCPSSHFKAEDPTFKIFEENDLDLIHFSILNIPPSWRQLAEKLTPSSNLKSYRNPVVITCGPRKVGKSTFGRFIANSLINNHDNVAYLDLDCGQTEFSTPGFLCLQILSKDPSASILGPPYSHKKSISHMKYIGALSIDKCTSLFIKSFHDLYVIFKRNYEHLNIPLYVNTMGWTTGLGLYTLKLIAQSIKPTHLFAIKSSDESSDCSSIKKDARQIPSNDSSVPEYVWDILYGDSEKNFDHSEKYVPLSSNEPVYISSIDSVVSEMDKVSKIHPTVLRSLMSMAYFHNRLENVYNFDLPLSSLKPFSISWSDVCVLVPPFKNRPNFKDLLPTLVLSVAGLSYSVCQPDCTIFEGMRIKMASSEDGLPECQGAAIIRAVDPVSRIFHVLTPISLQILKNSNINTIVVRPGFIAPRGIMDDQSSLSIDIYGQEPFKSVSSSYSASSSTPNNRKVRSNILRRSHGRQ